MRILGIADNHDASAAVVVDGRLVAAASQERFDRYKNSGHFPTDAIAAVLATAGLGAGQIDRVVFGTTFTPPWIVRRFPSSRRGDDVGHGQFTYLLNLYIQYQVALRRGGLVGIERRANEALLTRRMRGLGFHAPVTLLDHHLCHAQSAWRTQTKERCLVFTADAMGDGVTATVSLGRDRLQEQSGFAAINTLYSRVTECLGFTPLRHEGKITGLAAMAKPPEELLSHFRSVLSASDGRFSRYNYLARQTKDDTFHARLREFSREEVSAAVQQVVEEAVCAWVAYWVRKTGVPDVALAGGLFGNVKLNQRIAELPEVASLWVFPNMGDGGLSVGAALQLADAPPRRMETALLGPGLPGTLPAAEVDRVAALLAAGKVVARCAGRMEFGPRALGNRSIFARADDPAINTSLNQRLRRSEFMPFAPVVRAEDADGFFVGYKKANEAARFMTVCFACTDRFRALGAGTVHVDGTARPQVVAREEHPEVHALLTAYAARTGSPVLVNTSFNLHEEPIVASAEDARRAFAAGQLDALWLGGALVERR